MFDIKCICNNDLIIESNNIISLKIENDSNNLLKASICISKALNNKLIDYITTCKILINNKEYFTGNIKSIQIDNNYINITVIKKDDLCDNILPNNSIVKDNNLIEIFKRNNPDLFTKRNVFNNNEILENIDDNIIKNSLKINIDKSLPISELDLNISGSWNKLFNGYCDLTNKIKNKLKNGLISTLTPKKLIKSWPKIFDRLINNNKGFLRTKYFVTYSKLQATDTSVVNINNIKVNASNFDFKLAIGWEYYQFVTEFLHCKFINNTVQNNNKQSLNINLHNVQEYVEDNTCDYFFKSKIGNSIVNLILCEVKQFIINSMQNISIEFQMPFSEKLKINQQIKINNYICIINKIEIFFKQNKNIANITCIGSEYNNAFTNAILQDINIEQIINNTISNKTNNTLQKLNTNNQQNIKQDKNTNTSQATPINNEGNNMLITTVINNVSENSTEYHPVTDSNNSTLDIVDSINIINTTHEQMEKIKNIKDLKQINNILNENPTKLIINLKPIKTEHNKIEEIWIGNIEM